MNAFIWGMFFVLAPFFAFIVLAMERSKSALAMTIGLVLRFGLIVWGAWLLFVPGA